MIFIKLLTTITLRNDKINNNKCIYHCKHLNKIRSTKRQTGVHLSGLHVSKCNMLLFLATDREPTGLALSYFKDSCIVRCRAVTFGGIDCSKVELFLELDLERTIFVLSASRCLNNIIFLRILPIINNINNNTNNNVNQ